MLYIRHSRKKISQSTKQDMANQIKQLNVFSTTTNRDQKKKKIPPSNQAVQSNC